MEQTKITLPHEEAKERVYLEWPDGFTASYGAVWDNPEKFQNHEEHGGLPKAYYKKPKI